jgi:hypothetical protein
MHLTMQVTRYQSCGVTSSGVRRALGSTAMDRPKPVSYLMVFRRAGLKATTDDSLPNDLAPQSAYLTFFHLTQTLITLRVGSLSGNLNAQLYFGNEFSLSTTLASLRQSCWVVVHVLHPDWLSGGFGVKVGSLRLQPLEIGTDNHYANGNALRPGATT